MKREHWLIPETPFASYQDYLARTGESAALKARTVAAEAVLEEIERSGLLGRGGRRFSRRHEVEDRPQPPLPDPLRGLQRRGG